MKKDSPKTIILISIDDLRFDCISAETERVYLQRYGLEDRVSTPNLDRFADQGVRFSQAIASAPYTSPSHASLLSGMYSPRHGVRAFFYTKMREGVKTIAQVLGENGYRTFASCDFDTVFRTLDLARGMEVCEAQDNTKVLAALERYRDERKFLFFHFFDVHDPYGCSKFEIRPGYNEETEREYEALRRKHGLEPCNFLETVKRLWKMGHREDVVAQYIRGVNKFDRGRFAWIMDALEGMGLLEDALVVITADHGEGDCDGRTFSHGANLSEELIRVPLIFHDPARLPRGKVVDRQCSLVDVMPTILDLAGVDPPDCDGRSLVGAICDSGPDADSHGAPRGVHKDDLVYSERWCHSVRHDEMLEFTGRCKIAGHLVKPSFEVLLAQRCLRTPEYKFVLRGQEPDPADLTRDDDFLKWAFHSILHKQAIGQGYDNWLAKLEGDTLDRQALLEIFTRQARDTYSLFKIKEDPFEENNLLTDPSFLSMSEEFLDTIDEIEGSKNLQSESYISFDSEDEAVRIEDQLRSLGYI